MSAWMSLRMHTPITRRPDRRHARGQSLAEFAIIFPILFLLIAAIIQFGLIFWSQNTLTQIARDLGRYASTQQVCNTVGARADIVTKANEIAANSSLIGYSSGSWVLSTNVDVDWTVVTGSCPPVGNQEVAFVTIELHHNVPMFFQFLPISGALATSAEFRMEPVSE
jgi:Flp pilus assembly protein TadG